VGDGQSGRVRCRNEESETFVPRERLVAPKYLSLNRRLTLRSRIAVRRGARGSGVPVDPVRVRQARQEAGLSLAQVARDDISRTFLHFVEQGRSRPSRAVLELIAKRTGRPVSFFLAPAAEQPKVSILATDLLAIAGRVRNAMLAEGVGAAEYEALKLLEVALRQGAQLTRAIDAGAAKSAKRQRRQAVVVIEKKAS
jgi:transcriptional regulator with XRE-family HTH domain